MNRKSYKVSDAWKGLWILLLLPLSVVDAAEFFKFDNGELARPSGYREWIYVGTPVTPNELNNGKAAFPEFHNAYTDPESWAEWKRSGTLREGTILIKELVSVGATSAVSGKGYFECDFIGLEATIKSKKHFLGEPGHWAYFSFSTPDHMTLTAAAKPFPTARAVTVGSKAPPRMIGCSHSTIAVLRAGKAAGEAATGGTSSSLK